MVNDILPSDTEEKYAKQCCFYFEISSTKLGSDDLSLYPVISCVKFPESFKPKHTCSGMHIICTYFIIISDITFNVCILTDIIDVSKNIFLCLQFTDRPTTIFSEPISKKEQVPN